MSGLNAGTGFLLLVLGLCMPAAVKAQSDSLYQTLVAKAGLYHLQKDYKKAIPYYEKAFKLRPPDALNSYKAAGVYALDSNAFQAFHYLEMALDSGWTEAGWLSADPYFDYLRASMPAKWKSTEAKALALERRYETSLAHPALRRQINQIMLKDQQLRYKRAQARTDEETRAVNKEIQRADLDNLDKAKAILKQYGWPKISDIGKDGQNNLWLIVQHADQDIFFQKAALSAMEKITEKGELNLENYAFLYDRMQCNLNFKQLYGTQVNWTQNGQASGFRPIISEHLVDERRKEIGLLPLSIYALSYGFEYRVPAADEAAARDSADLADTRRLIDSAGYFYAAKEFPKTYDYYNHASTIQGGMSSADNYKAATVFAKIYAETGEQKYRDIALDFLSLLSMRQELSKARLENQAEFKVLSDEPRWIDFYKHFK